MLQEIVNAIVAVGGNAAGDGLNPLGAILMLALFGFLTIVVSAVIIAVAWVVIVGPFWLMGQIDAIRTPTMFFF